MVLALTRVLRSDIRFMSSASARLVRDQSADVLATRPKRRPVASPTLPLEAVAVTEQVQRTIQNSLKYAKLNLRDLGQALRNSDSSNPKFRPLQRRPRENTEGTGEKDTLSLDYSAEDVALSKAVAAAPGNLAANVYVMSELRRCRPNFVPRTIMDFGSGTAVSVSAAARVFRERSDYVSMSDELESGSCEVPRYSDGPQRAGERSGRAMLDWLPDGSSSLTGVALVDESPTFRRLGSQILRVDEFLTSSEARCDIKAFRSLHDVRGRASSEGFDIVSASYALGEIVRASLMLKSTDDEDDNTRLNFERLVERRLKGCVLSLWKSLKPGGALVVIESGSRMGFDTLLFVRNVLLKHGQRERAQLETKTLSTEQNEGMTQSTPVVVAPCLHSGKCPLDGNTSRSRVCRFAQRLNRPPYLRTALPLPNGFEDQYFSYIIVEKRAIAGRHHDQSVHAPPEEAGSEWGRLVNPPQRRGRHVILDACTSDAKLERRVVAKGESDGVYALARKARWGDIWPVRPASSAQEVIF